jgi:hypothetical protein
MGLHAVSETTFSTSKPAGPQDVLGTCRPWKRSVGTGFANSGLVETDAGAV